MGGLLADITRKSIDYYTLLGGEEFSSFIEQPDKRGKSDDHRKKTSFAWKPGLPFQTAFIDILMQTKYKDSPANMMDTPSQFGVQGGLRFGDLSLGRRQCTQQVARRAAHRAAQRFRRQRADAPRAQDDGAGALLNLSVA
jgi:hypothetical protein